MKIQILGTGCAKCSNLFDNAKQAAQEAGVDCDIEKVTDLAEMMKMGVMTTPALVVDGVVKSTGKLLDSAKIRSIIEECK
ncbi:MAG: thioredoxin family protein [Sedimentisphaeraceae bacterium JB056]